jgi:hypothetical protein
MGLMRVEDLLIIRSPRVAAKILSTMVSSGRLKVEWHPLHPELGEEGEAEIEQAEQDKANE